MSAGAVWISDAAPTLLFVGANVMYRVKFTVLAVVVTRVAVDALPVSAPESVLAATDPTVRMFVDGT